MISTRNFALLPEETKHDIGETHKNLALVKRKDNEEMLKMNKVITAQSTQLRV